MGGVNHEIVRTELGLFGFRHWASFAAAPHCGTNDPKGGRFPLLSQTLVHIDPVWQRPGLAAHQTGRLCSPIRGLCQDIAQKSAESKPRGELAPARSRGKILENSMTRKLATAGPVPDEARINHVRLGHLINHSFAREPETGRHKPECETCLAQFRSG